MKRFSKIYKEDLDIVGKKALELAELVRLGIPIPDGFVITTDFFNKFLNQTGITHKINEIKKLDHPSIRDSVVKLFEPVKEEIMHTHIPNNLVSELHNFYKKLVGPFNDNSLNLFTSSSSNNKSLMYENIKGDANFLIKIKEIWASNLHNPVAIIVQRNVKSKTKGTITTNNPPKGFENIAQKIQKYFYFPKVLEYVIEKNKIYITTILPFTGKVEELVKQINKKIRKVLIKGNSINPGIVTGYVKVLRKNHDSIKTLSDKIIVLPRLDISIYLKLKKAKAIVVEDVLRNSYDKMVYRKNIKIPTIEGIKNATGLLQNGNVITVNGISGEIYKGGLV